MSAEKPGMREAIDHVASNMVRSGQYTGPSGRPITHEEAARRVASSVKRGDQIRESRG